MTTISVVVVGLVVVNIALFTVVVWQVYRQQEQIKRVRRQMKRMRIDHNWRLCGLETREKQRNAD